MHSYVSLQVEWYGLDLRLSWIISMVADKHQHPYIWVEVKLLVIEIAIPQ